MMMDLIWSEPRVIIVTLAFVHIGIVFLFWWSYARFLRQLPRNSAKRIVPWILYIICLVSVPLLQISMAPAQTIFVAGVVVIESAVAIVTTFTVLKNARRTQIS
jgi:hypothetical protein